MGLSLCRCLALGLLLVFLNLTMDCENLFADVNDGFTLTPVAVLVYNINVFTFILACRVKDRKKDSINNRRLTREVLTKDGCTWSSTCKS